jgi:small subunit ribosomal protein S9
MAEDERNDRPQEPEAEQPQADQPPEEQPAEDQPQAEEPQDQPQAEEPQEQPQAEEPQDQPQAEEPPAEQEQPAAEEAGDEPPQAAPGDEAGEREERPRGRRDRKQGDQPQEEVIPGAHLEPDLVLEEQREAEEGEFAEYAEVEVVAEEGEEPVAEEGEAAEAAPEPREPLDLAADARYAATGKRKTAVARVTLRPGDGTYQINGRHLDEFFPRIKLQRIARQPLEVAGYGSRMDVVARIHGGGVAAQATALRHGIARALVEADPNLRVELKRRGYLTRDPRVKERKKAGLKKARKRPQFSKR